MATVREIANQAREQAVRREQENNAALNRMRTQDYSNNTMRTNTGRQTSPVSSPVRESQPRQNRSPAAELPAEQSTAATAPTPQRPERPNTPESTIAGASPITRNVDAGTETVAGQLDSILDKNSPYLKLARDNARRAANSRGLINSTMAARAGEEAAISAALPIAQQDAKTYFEQSGNNQVTENRFAENQQSASLNSQLSAQENEQTLVRMEFEQQNKELMAQINNQLAMEKDENSSRLRQELELTLADKKLSNDMKTTFATEMSRIMTETQAQIGTIGSSDRTPKQQEAAIKQIIRQRDSQIKLLRDMMDDSVQWEWF